MDIVSLRDELLAEADRMISLDDAGRERELVMIALRLGHAHDMAWRELRELDEEFLREQIANRGGGNEVAPDGAEPVPQHDDP